MSMKNPVHPGKLIRADLEALDLSVARGAEALGVSRSQLNRVIVGESAISAEMALRLEAVLGASAGTWMRMQAAYDLAQLRNGEQNPATNLNRIKVPLAEG